MFHRLLLAVTNFFIASSVFASTVTVDLTLPKTKITTISPYIYGLGTYMGEDHNKENTWALRPTYFRFGGNMAEVFNWKIDCWNTGSDWYFRNFKSPKNSMIDSFMASNKSQNIASAIVVPSMGWVARDGTSGSFPVSTYDKQSDVRDGFGNGISIDGQAKIKALPDRALLKITPEWVSDWVKHLKSHFGKMPHYYIVGNEPMLWHETHRDVHPDPATYDEVFTKFVATATAIRLADPDAVIIGPALWGWLPMQQSAFDERGSWNNYHKFADRERHENKPFLQWFLESIVKEEKKLGIQLLDVVDVHYYPNDTKLGTLPESVPESRAARIASTRSLWDTAYVDDSWIKERIYLIPRLKKLVAKIKPSLRVAIGEYNFGAELDISGGIALAETLGIFAKEGLWSANYWTVPSPNSAAAQAFKLYRNYDGQGSSFGSQLINDLSFIHEDHSVFTAYEPALHTFTIIVINKSQSKSQTFIVKSPQNLVKSPIIRIFQHDPSHILSSEKSAVKFREKFQLSMPPLSFALIEIKN